MFAQPMVYFIFLKISHPSHSVRPLSVMFALCETYLWSLLIGPEMGTQYRLDSPCLSLLGICRLVSKSIVSVSLLGNGEKAAFREKGDKNKSKCNKKQRQQLQDPQKCEKLKS